MTKSEMGQNPRFLSTYINLKEILRSGFFVKRNKFPQHEMNYLLQVGLSDPLVDGVARPV